MSTRAGAGRQGRFVPNSDWLANAMQRQEKQRVAAQSVASPNFDFLPKRDALLVQLGTLAERYFLDDPNTALLKLRQFGEVTAQRAAAHAGIFVSTDEGQSELLRRLRSRGCR